MKPQIMFIVESKYDAVKSERLKNSLNFNSCFCVSCRGKSGGLLLFWKEEMDISIKSFSEGHIDALIRRKNGYWRFSDFYGNPKTEKRIHSWNLLERLSEDNDTPWIVGGDFNEIISEEEKSRGWARRNSNQMELFISSLNHYKLIDARYRGSKFTWRRGKSKNGRILERLDRILMNQEMEASVNNLVINHLGFLSSDHRPIAASWEFKDEQTKVSKNGKLQQFEEGWLKIKGAEEVIKRCWVNHPNPKAQNLCDNMVDCINKLHRWNKERLNDSLRSAISRKEEEIQALAACEGDDGWADSLRAEDKLEALLEEEEDFWRSRSREVWLQSGVRNTKWFHAKASQRRRRNHIEGIWSKEGIWEEDELRVGEIATNYFKDLFQSSRLEDNVIKDVIDCTTPKITEE